MLSGRALFRSKGSVRRFANSSSGDKVLSYWQGLLAKRSEPSPPVSSRNSAASEMDVRDLMQTAIRVRKGNVPGILPDQLAGMLMNFYHQKLNTATSRAEFFYTLTAELGVESEPEFACFRH